MHEQKLSAAPFRPRSGGVVYPCDVASPRPCFKNFGDIELDLQITPVCPGYRATGESRWVVTSLRLGKALKAVCLENSGRLRMLFRKEFGAQF
jgi:hypothetical protein